ncbi:ABC transporter permease [Clostridium felsineum]|uniref:ABC transporter permease n=1 Tax=Clostridium felsineum TaxID=36839 RepID=UPI00098C6EBD|nr:ABC transporter permease [Clostridium felsineum]URZ16952.1 Dipeptide transport system permease protein DppB [Clostridium felsineum DSM 794]
MIKYIVKRLLLMIPIIIVTSFIIYMIFSFAPGDIVTSMKVNSKEKVEMRHKYHLDEPKVIQYFRWLKGAVKGDLGESYKLNQPVKRVINKYIWNSFYLQFISFILAVLIAIPIGVISATRKHSIIDSGFTILSLIGVSVPTFFLGLILIKIFAADLNVFPVEGMTTTGETLHGMNKILDIFYHMALPCIVLTFVNAATLIRYVRSSMLEVIKQDYMMTARAKGLKEKIIIYRHALKNAMIPLVTIFGMSIANLFTGAIITEEVFSWPGIGKLSLDAVFQRDYPLLMGINMIIVVLTFLGNLVADVLYAVVDPRIKYK